MCYAAPPLAFARQPASEVNLAEPRSYAIAAGKLNDTLAAIAAMSGREVTFEAGQTRDLMAGEVKGEFVARAAVERALSGSGLLVEERASGTLVVKPAVIEVTAKRDEAETSFKAGRSNTATRSGGYLQDVPASVTLITSKVLETQQIVNLQESLRNVSGVLLSQSPQGAPQYMIRGYAASATSNGVADDGAALTSVYGVERVEVLKGPQAILSGGDSLGGGVNVVTKKPQAERVRDVSLQFGTNADKTVAVDLSDALNDEKTLSYRLIGVVADASSAQGGYDGRTNRSFMPSLRWKDRTTDLIVGASYTKQHAPMPFYTFASRDGSLLPAPAIPLANRGDGFDNTDKKLYFQLERQLTPSLVLVSRMQRSVSALELHVPSPLDLNYPDEAAPLVTDGTALFAISRNVDETTTSSGDHYLRGSFATGAVRHKLSVGFNHSNTAYGSTQWEGEPIVGQVYPATSIDFPSARARSTTLSYTGRFRHEQKGLYLQDMATYGDWTLLVNARRTRYHSPASASYYAGLGQTFSDPASTVTRNTPGVGLVYSLNPETSLYASYAEGFSPEPGLSCTFEKIPPQQTRNKEVGAKLDLFDSKLSVTASVFSLQLANRSRYRVLQDCYDVTEGDRTRGVEIDVQGQAAKGLDVIFNYSYKSVTDPLDASTVFPGESKHKTSLWSNYTFQSAALAGYGIGVGVSASTGSLGTYDTTYPFRLPGQAQIDASVFYTANKLSVILGVRNLTDRLLYSPASANSFVPVLPGRQFMLTVKRSFN